MSILIRMVRTRSFDPSSALAKAVDLFSSKGYSETSMEDIVRATGVSRYGLYGTFGNKRELFEQALDKYADRMGKQAFLRLLERGARGNDPMPPHSPKECGSASPPNFRRADRGYVCHGGEQGLPVHPHRHGTGAPG